MTIPAPQSEPAIPDTALPIEEPTRSRVAAELQNIRAAVFEIESKNVRRYDERSIEILKILLSTTERLEAADINFIAIELNQVQDIEKLRKKINNLISAIYNNTTTPLIIGKQIFYKQPYLYLDIKKQTPEEKSVSASLAPPIRPYKDKEKLERRLEFAIQKTAKRGFRQKSFLTSLLEACKEERSVTPKYCVQRFKDTYPDKPLAPAKERCFQVEPRQNINDRPEEFGFRVINDPSTGRSQAELTDTVKDFEKEIEAAKEIPDTDKLRERITESLKHISTSKTLTLEKIGCCLSIMLEKIGTGGWVTSKEIIELSKGEGVELTPNDIHTLFKRIRDINTEEPNLLGYKIARMGEDQFRLELTENYIKTDIGYNKLPDHPVKIAKIKFNRVLYGSTVGIYLKTGNKEDTPRGKLLSILAEHAEKSEGLSIKTIAELLNTDQIHAFRLTRGIIVVAKNNNWPITIDFDKDKRAYYLQTKGENIENPKIAALKTFVQEKSLSGQDPIDITSEQFLDEVMTALAKQDLRIDRMTAKKHLIEILRSRVSAQARVLKSQHHFVVEDARLKELLFNFLADKALKGQQFSTEEIVKLATSQNIKTSKRLIEQFIRRTLIINNDEPTILGYKLTKISANTYNIYIVEPTEKYTPTELTYKKNFAVIPIKIEEDSKFDREIFERKMSKWIKIKGRRGFVPLSLLHIVFLELARYSEQGLAVSPKLMEKSIGIKEFTADVIKQTLADIANFIKLHDPRNSQVQLRRYKKFTYYLETKDLYKKIKSRSTPAKKVGAAIKRIAQRVNTRFRIRHGEAEEAQEDPDLDPDDLDFS